MGQEHLQVLEAPAGLDALLAGMVKQPEILSVSDESDIDFVPVSGRIALPLNPDPSQHGHEQAGFHRGPTQRLQAFALPKLDGEIGFKGEVKGFAVVNLRGNRGQRLDRGVDIREGRQNRWPSTSGSATG